MSRAILVRFVTLSGWALGLSAQPAATRAQGYAGVVPGTDTVPGSVAGAAGSQTTVTWPGFQVLGDGGTRVFVQTSGPVQPELKRDGANWLVIIPGVLLPRGNVRLPLDTHFFNTPVTTARLTP